MGTRRATSTTPSGGLADEAVAEELSVGAAPSARRAPGRRRLLGAAVAAAVLAAAVAWQVVPLLAPSTTGVDLVVTGASLGRLDVESGVLDPWSGVGSVDQVAVVGDTTVVRFAPAPLDPAAPVRSYRGGAATAVGAADQILLTAQGQRLWLVTDEADVAGGAPRPATATLVRTSGDPLSPVRPLPPNREVIGSVDAGLLLARGVGRNRVVEVYDPAARVVERVLGPVGLLLATGGPLATASVPCWVGDCPMYVIDTRTGERERLLPPDGTLYSGRPVPSPDGAQVAAVVRRLSDGQPELAVAQFGGPLLPVEGVAAQPGSTVVWGPDGWLVVPDGTGYVTLYRAGDEPRRVVLPAGTSVAAVVPAA